MVIGEPIKHSIGEILNWTENSPGPTSETNIVSAGDRNVKYFKLCHNQERWKHKFGKLNMNSVIGFEEE